MEDSKPKDAAAKRHKKYGKKVVRLGLAENVGLLSTKIIDKNKKRAARKNTKKARRANR